MGGLAGNEPAEAVTRASAAIGLLAGAECRSHLGRAHDILGRSLAAAGRPGAVAALEQAAAIFAECGAAWRKDRSIQALRRLGSGGGGPLRPRSAPPRSPGGSGRWPGSRPGG